MKTPLEKTRDDLHKQELARFARFQGWLKTYGDLWKSMQVTSASCRVDGSWKNLATCVVLNEAPPDKHRVIVRPTPEFCAYRVSVPIQQLPEFLRALARKQRVPDYLPGKTKPRDIDLNVGGRWHDPWRHRRQHENFGLKRYCLAFQSENGDHHNWPGYEFLDKVDDKLGLKEPAFDGLADLYKTLFPSMNFDRSHLHARADILAPLPLTLSCADDGSTVTLTAPENAFNHKVGLRFFFRPARASYFEKFTLRMDLAKGQADRRDWCVPIRWPAGSERGKAMLYFDEDKIDEIEIRRWQDAINARLAVNTYFDPGHERLKAGLRLNDPRASRRFEAAVIKILTMLGINVISYVEEENNADGAAVYEVREGKPTVYLIECTIHKARAKFSLIRERARRLKTVVGEAEIIPVIFVATDGEGDRQEASELGITLVDAGSIETLIHFLENSAAPEAVNQLFASLRANFPVSFRFR